MALQGSAEKLQQFSWLVTENEPGEQPLVEWKKSIVSDNGREWMKLIIAAKNGSHIPSPIAVGLLDSIEELELRFQHHAAPFQFMPFVFQFSDTISKLKIVNQYGPLESDRTHFNITSYNGFEKLKEVRLVRPSAIDRLDFLLCFKHLQYLDVDLRGIRNNKLFCDGWMHLPADRQGKLRFIHTEGMQHSNIWKEIPTLQNVKLQICDNSINATHQKWVTARKDIVDLSL